ncbi:minor capsid protein [Desulfofundulus sp. TPOSR]|uniref:phage head morphogenesis protein n=1 Tax=Desulfofundulus sp. TPOSR TaxID=2714340 RepID=UPI001408C11C|nr:phage minor head protein [Desulfofundulus sp. TPOSR]NHM25452.1 minor capsid protein [Desulfofundulus sp. TPOSR]NHM27040.1 minor capsid protein [Desulfofundulus sp. TPOSR]
MDIRLEPLAFEEAVEFFRDKVVLPPGDFEKLWGEYRSLAFSVAGIAALDVLKDIYEALLRAIEEGLTQQDFARQVNEILESRGWQGLTPYRLDNIFRTNIQTAYMVGHYRRMTDPDIVERRPYWMYNAVNDRRTRPTHRALDGKVYRYDHPFWDTWYPPNGYRCRCGVISLSEEQVRRRGLTVETEVPGMIEPPGQPARPLLPDPGFAHNPAKTKWEPDLSKYPPALRQAYQARATE